MRFGALDSVRCRARCCAVLSAVLCGSAVARSVVLRGSSEVRSL